MQIYFKTLLIQFDKQIKAKNESIHLPFSVQREAPQQRKLFQDILVFFLLMKVNHTKNFKFAVPCMYFSVKETMLNTDFSPLQNFFKIAHK
jgi:hypothetical protein